jgi:hypothetical protein
MPAVQSQANPAPASTGHIDIDDGAEFDPFEQLQEQADQEQLRQARSMRRHEGWY